MPCRVSQAGRRPNGPQKSLRQNSREAHHCQSKGFTIYVKNMRMRRASRERGAVCICLLVLTPVSSCSCNRRPSPLQAKSPSMFSLKNFIYRIYRATKRVLNRSQTRTGPQVDIGEGSHDAAGPYQPYPFTAPAPPSFLCRSGGSLTVDIHARMLFYAISCDNC